MMKTTITTDFMSMDCIINIQKHKQFYQYKHNTLTYRVYDDKFPKNNCVTSKLKIEVGM